jgi:hypothetical protein
MLASRAARARRQCPVCRGVCDHPRINHALLRVLADAFPQAGDGAISAASTGQSSRAVDALLRQLAVHNTPGQETEDQVTRWDLRQLTTGLLRLPVVDNNRMRTRGGGWRDTADQSTLHERDAVVEDARQLRHSLEQVMTVIAE